MLDDEKFYKYDAWNRVVEVHDKGDYHVDAAGDLAGSDLGHLIATYEYDVLGRMIHKTVSASGDLNTTGDGDYFYYDGHRLLEHHKHNGTSLALYRQYVYGLDYIDEVVAYYDSDQTAAAPHFILQDVNYNVVATTDHEGHLEQQYNYKPYGERLAAEQIESDGTITDILATPEQIALSLGYKGLWYDTETASWHNRARDYVPSLGRFRQRDPNETALLLNTALASKAQVISAFASLTAGAQYGDGMSLYQPFASNPMVFSDPSGEVIQYLVSALVGGAASALYKSIELTLSGRAAHQDLTDSLYEIVGAAGRGGIAGLAFMACAHGGGAILNMTMGIATASGTSLVGGAMGVAFGLNGLYQADQRSQNALDAMDELEMTMALVDAGFSSVMTLGGAIGIRQGLRSGFVVRTPEGAAVQDQSAAALYARGRVAAGARLYRTGMRGISRGSDSPYWALEDPAAPGYSARYGVPPENMGKPDFVLCGRLKAGAQFITRTAPRVGANPGGGIEVVVEPGGVTNIQTWQGAPGS